MLPKSLIYGSGGPLVALFAAASAPQNLLGQGAPLRCASWDGSKQPAISRHPTTSAGLSRPVTRNRRRFGFTGYFHEPYLSKDPSR